MNKKIKIAFHETGHAVMALICQQKIQKISLREMDSPLGGDKYLAFMKLEPADTNVKFTGEKAIKKIMIALGGYASEILFFDGVANIGGDDLTIAARTTENMFQIPEFKNWIAELPIPSPSALDMIENPSIRAYIDYKMGDCINMLAPHKALIQSIVDELLLKKELTGEEVNAIFEKYMTLRL